MVITKPGTMCITSNIRIKQKTNFVSRGGDKLHQFISDKGIKINDKCCADIGISTGGLQMYY